MAASAQSVDSGRRSARTAAPGILRPRARQPDQHRPDSPSRSSRRRQRTRRQHRRVLKRSLMRPPHARRPLDRRGPPERGHPEQGDVAFLAEFIDEIGPGRRAGGRSRAASSPHDPARRRRASWPNPAGVAAVAANLLQNAFQFTRPGDHRHASCDRERRSGAHRDPGSMRAASPEETPTTCSGPSSSGAPTAPAWGSASRLCRSAVRSQRRASDCARSCRAGCVFAIDLAECRALADAAVA